jgi:23S rRNA (cytosine1962-C5)-methyltransferase
MTEQEVARQAEMLKNRVAKAQKHLARGFAREHIEAYRLYDRDIPEIRAVVDWYAGHVVVGEYARQKTDDTPGWLEDMASAVARGLDVAEARVHLRRRRTRPAEGERYQKLAASGRRLEVRERDLRFWVNLDDYVDTGLFPDHRETRARVREESRGKRVLNLYGYTGAFTCAAAAGGATETWTVDTSATYLDWARDNLALNQQKAPQHHLERSDARDFLAASARQRAQFDVIVLDPPSYSDHGGEGYALDVGRDHRALVEESLAVLAQRGILYFSTNHQRFTPDLEGLSVAECREITEATVPRDYRNRQVHRCWRLVAL